MFLSCDADGLWQWKRQPFALLQHAIFPLARAMKNVQPTV
jgi:hypothetical protein